MLQSPDEPEPLPGVGVATARIAREAMVKSFENMIDERGGLGVDANARTTGECSMGNSSARIALLYVCRGAVSTAMTSTVTMTHWQ